MRRARQNLFKAGVNWQATDKFTLGLNGRRTKDDYDSTLGVQKGEYIERESGCELQLFGNTAPSRAYASWQRRRAIC